MKLVFFEAPLFTRLLPDYLDDDEYREVQSALLENPEMGGLRVIYYHLSSDNQIWFFTLYDKDEMADLSPDEKKQLKQTIQKELTVRRAKL